MKIYDDLYEILDVGSLSLKSARKSQYVINGDNLQWYEAQGGLFVYHVSPYLCFQWSLNVIFNSVHGQAMLSTIVVERIQPEGGEPERSALRWFLH